MYGVSVRTLDSESKKKKDFHCGPDRRHSAGPQLLGCWPGADQLRTRTTAGFKCKQVQHAANEAAHHCVDAQFDCPKSTGKVETYYVTIRGKKKFLSTRQDSDWWWGHGRVSERKRTKETRSTRLVYPKGRSNKSHRPKVNSLEETPPCRFCVGPAHAWWGHYPSMSNDKGGGRGLKPAH